MLNWLDRKQRQKNEGQKYGVGYHQRNAHRGATINRKYFSALHFSVVAFLKVSDVGQDACATVFAAVIVFP